MNTLIKQPIEVNKQAFAKAVEVYGNKLQAIKNIKDEVRKFIPKARIDDSFLDDVMNNFYDLLLVKYQKQNTLNLRAEKLAELLEFDLSNLIQYTNTYYELKNIESPSEATFTTYAETDEEIKRLTHVQKLIDTIEDIETQVGVKAYPFDVAKAFRRILTFNVRTNTYEPNARWIKGDNRF